MSEYVPLGYPVVGNVSVATPLPFSVAVVSVVLLAWKLTAPDGVAPLPEAGVTVTVSVTELPELTGLGDAVSTVLLAASILSVAALDVEAVSLESPL